MANYESPLFSLCWELVAHEAAHETEQKFTESPKKLRDARVKLPVCRAFRPTAPSPFLVSTCFTSFHLLIPQRYESSRNRPREVGEVALIGFSGRYCFSYLFMLCVCVCVFFFSALSGPFLLTVLPDKPSWNTFVFLLSVCSLSFEGNTNTDKISCYAFWTWSEIRHFGALLLSASIKPLEAHQDATVNRQTRIFCWHIDFLICVWVFFFTLLERIRPAWFVLFDP